MFNIHFAIGIIVGPKV